MNDAPLYPGATLGVLGGGQLGAMFAAAALRMGYWVAVWDPDSDAPAHRVAGLSFSKSFSDAIAAQEFTRSVSAVTLEWENVPAALCEQLAERHPVRPSGAVLRIIQDRIEQKQFLQVRGFPVPSFRIVEAPHRLADAVNELGGSVICKTATSGYDGKGQWTIRHPAETAGVEAALGAMVPRGARWIVESRVDFERELSVLVVRGQDGDQRVYPVVENRHEGGILRLSTAPARIAGEVSEQARDLAMRAVRALNGVGVFCVELFHTRTGALFINEIAPRPHNSGHYTLDACSVSQFEQQVRALCGLPLGEVRLLSAAAMVNVIGQDLETVTSSQGCRDLLATPGAVLHLYGKRVARPGRKMGHVTFLADRAEQAEARASLFEKSLRS
ncbi:MAG TPA: 5-(carboxyamino)imidazole ribonucleotide synthase [Nitrospira sp.]|nr:5-(carboxyamino)imidazole ribonucleotide synthase [Nitrospira sp.]